MRLLPAVLCAAVVCWLLPAPHRASSPPTVGSDARAMVVDSGCKPLAPIDVELSLPDGDGPGVVTVQARIAPRMELHALTWSWEPSADVRMLAGAADGAGEPGRGVPSDAEVELLVPNDGRRHRVDLVATGRLRTPDGEEPEFVTAVRSVTWGPLPWPGPIVTSTDAETGARLPFVVVPSTHAPAGAGGGR
jgi:hypothetical protein